MWVGDDAPHVTAAAAAAAMISTCLHANTGATCFVMN
jgi:hypothetical protein